MFLGVTTLGMALGPTGSQNNDFVWQSMWLKYAKIMQTSVNIVWGKVA